jgi:hypothetical protein
MKKKCQHVWFKYAFSFSFGSTQLMECAHCPAIK